MNITYLEKGSAWPKNTYTLRNNFNVQSKV